MHALRRRPLLTRLVLAWFLLALGVAQVAPVFADHSAMAMALPAAGHAHQDDHADHAHHEDHAHHDGAPDDADTPHAHVHTLDCVLCLGVWVPPHEFRLRTAAQPLPHLLRPAVAARIAALTGGLLNARAPPPPRA